MSDDEDDDDDDGVEYDETMRFSPPAMVEGVRQNEAEEECE